VLQRTALPLRRPLAVAVALALLVSLVVATSPRPAAAQPAALPDLVEIRTRRDAGSQAVPGLEAIAPESITATPLVPLQETTIALAEGDSAVEVVEVETGTVRLLAELTASPADVELSVERDGDPSEVCADGTCDLRAPQPGTYEVRVESVLASAPGATDAVTFGTAVVPTDGPDDLSVETVGSPPEQRLVYRAAPEAGASRHGAVVVGGDVIGVDVDRLADDVAKTASNPTPEHGDTFTYTLEVEPNVTPQDLTYTITDPIPAGLTYVAGSATGGATVTDGVVTWEPTVDADTGDGYTITTNDEDPSCATPTVADYPATGGYIDFRDRFATFPGVAGDNVPYSAFGSGAPFDFFGEQYQGLAFTDDGFVVFDAAEHYGGEPFTPQQVPDPALPNNLLAGLWQDSEIVATEERGVALVQVGGDGADSLAIVDYRGLEPYSPEEDPVPGAPTYDLQVWLNRTPDPEPGQYEAFFAYQDVGNVAEPVTVGVEDASGVLGSALLAREDPSGQLTDDTVVCLDYAPPPDPASYQVTVDRDAPLGPLTSAATHTTDDPAAEPAEASATVDVQPDTTAPAVTLTPIPAATGPGARARAQGTTSEPARVTLTTRTSAGSVVGARTVPSDDGTFVADLDLGAREGTFTVTATAEDRPAGNPSSPVSRSFLWDRVSRRPTLDQLPQVTRANQSRYVVRGTAEPGANVNLRLRDRSGRFTDLTDFADPARAVGAGRFTATFDLSGLDDGPITAVAVATDRFGNVSDGSLTYRTTKSTAPPADPDPGPDPGPDPEPDPDPPPRPRPEPDQEPPPPSQPAPEPDPGRAPVPSPSAAPAPSPAPEPAPPPAAQPPAVEQAVLRAAGGGRIQTSIEVSRAAYDTAQTVLLARADAYPDALAGSTLATAEGAPLLLNPSDALDPDVAAEIARLGASRVVLLGGETAQGPQVVFELVARGLTVERIGGASRFETAALVADRVGALVPVDEFVVVEGGNAEPSRGWPDALSASGLAASEGLPILLATADSVPAETAARLRPDTDVLVVGGVNAIGDGVAAALDQSAGSVTRLAGATRYGTSAAVAEEAVARGLDLSTVWVATGLNFPDALSAGGAAGAVRTTLLLIDGQGLDASAESRDFLSSRAAIVDTVRIAGGDQVVTPEVAAALQTAIAAP